MPAASLLPFSWRLPCRAVRHHAARWTVPALLLLFAAGPVQAQSLPLEQVDPPAEEVLDVHLHFGDLMRQYQQLQPLPPDDTTNAQPINGLDIDGLVLDETRTRIGRSFYTAFYQQWTPPENASGFTVTVQERPLRGQGVLVSVKVNDELAFQTRLQPRADFESIARQAVAYARHRLAQTGPQVII